MTTLLAQLAGLGAAGVILYVGLLAKALIRPKPYDWPVWVCRARLEYWAWRARRRQRRDARICAACCVTVISEKRTSMLNQVPEESGSWTDVDDFAARAAYCATVVTESLDRLGDVLAPTSRMIGDASRQLDTLIATLSDDRDEA